MTEEGQRRPAKLSQRQMQELKEARKRGKTVKRAQRATSNIFAMFTQSQIQEYKEAFTMIDQDRDGFIGMDDLKDMYSSLGRVPPDAELTAMIKEAPGQLNFTAFLTLFGEKVSGTDPESTILNAFAMFDEDNTGKIAEDYLKDLLENMGDNFSKEEIKQTWKEAPLKDGQVDYVKMVSIIKGTQTDESE